MLNENILREIQNGFYLLIVFLTIVDVLCYFVVVILIYFFLETDILQKRDKIGFNNLFRSSTIIKKRVV